MQLTVLTKMFIILGSILGLVLGSFVKALADRSLKGKSFWGRSYCPKCKKTLRYYDLFPILSFISTKGRCRYCHNKIGFEYPLMELVMGVLIAYLFSQYSNNFQLLISEFKFQVSDIYAVSILISNLFFKIFFICVLVVLFLTDLKKMFIPDRIILPSIKIGFIFSLVLSVYKVGYLYYFLNNTLFGKYLLSHSDYFQRHAFYTLEPFLYSIMIGLLIGGFFWGLIIITKGKGMGGGDVKLGAFMGLMLGFPQAVLAILLSFISGAIFSIFLILLGKKSFGQTIPFGPFLVLGSLVVLFWGEKILNWYLSLKV